MLDDSIALKNLIEDVQRSPTVDHVVLGDNLEPTHNRFFRENVLVMRHAKAYSDAKVCEPIESICRHVMSFPREKRVGTFNPDPLGLRSSLVLLRLGFSWRFGSIGCTPALALAGVLAFAAVVTGLTATLAFARILALTSVFFSFVFVLLVLAAVITHAYRFDSGIALVRG